MNALEAIQGQGQVSVRSFQDKDNQGVVVEIEDSGMGIPQEHLERISNLSFQPNPKEPPWAGRELRDHPEAWRCDQGEQPARSRTTIMIRLPSEQAESLRG